MATHPSILAWKIPWTGYSPWSCKESDTTEWLMHDDEEYWAYFYVLVGHLHIFFGKNVYSDLLPILNAKATSHTLVAQQTLWNLSRDSVLVFSAVQSLSLVGLFATPWTAARQASLSITNSQSSSLLELMSVELVMPSKHLILCHPLLSPSIFPSIRIFSNESVLHIRWPKYCSISFRISPSNEYSGLISFRID